MQRYIQQLIEDLEQVASNPPTPPYLEPPPHIESDRVVVELALTPFKPLYEWTGIEMEAFPGMWLLDAEESNAVNQAIFKVFAAMNIELIDIPPDIPPEILYSVLTRNWDEQVQYMPIAGFDLELCTYNPDTCPYGEFCDCFLDPDFMSLEDDNPDLVKNISDDDLPF